MESIEPSTDRRVTPDPGNASVSQILTLASPLILKAGAVNTPNPQLVTRFVASGVFV